MSGRSGKHGADERRVWRKVHLMIEADSHEVRAVEMTDHWHGDGDIDQPPRGAPGEILVEPGRGGRG